MGSRDSERLASCSTEGDLEEDTNSISTESVYGSDFESNTTGGDDDNAGWETYESDDSDSDGSIPDPDEIMDMASSGPLFDVDRICKVVNGPICWKCFSWSPYFRCENCDRAFHRECVLMAPGFPDPIFDKSLEEAFLCNYKEVKLEKCAICVVSEETQIDKFRNMSREEFNGTLLLISRYVHAEFGIDILPEIQTSGITTAEILEKTSCSEYKTIEGFYSDYKLIEYEIVKKYAVESEEKVVVDTVLNTVELYLHVMLSCVDCMTKYFNPEGRPYNTKEFSQITRQICTEPHAVLWIKEGTFPFWPAKILAHYPVKKKILIQFFAETAVGKMYPYPSDEVDCQTYSSVFPDKKPRKAETKLAKACADCNAYINNLREKFGEEGVMVPQNSVRFDGDLKAYKRTMFPLYAFENKQTEEGELVNPADNQEA